MRTVLGHERTIEDLRTLAERGDLSHGYAFYGPAMVGKRTVAQALARFLEKGEFAAPSPGEVMRDMMTVDLAFAKQLDPDRKDSVSIDAVREIRSFLWQKPVASSKRTLVIDEAEFLTTEAQNALLKVTEEPPASSLLIIVTSDLDGLLPTIASRLQKIYFGAVPEEDIARWLVSGAGDTIGAAAAPAKTKAATIAKHAMGKPGLAVRLTTDEAFAAGIALAEKFLKTPPAARRDFIKTLIEPDDFNLRVFLEAVIVVLAWDAHERPSAAKAALWHKALSLYGNVMDFGLNPRLQLQALLA